MSVSSSVVVSGSGNSKVFYSGDSGYDVDVTGRASLYVSGGAYVSGVTVRTSSYLYISSGGTVSSLMLSAGTGRIFSGGKLAGGELSGRTMLVVSSGGTAAGLSVTSNGNVNVDVYANDSATVISGSNARGMFSLSNGVASNFILYSRGAQAVYSGALTSDITVGRSGNLYVSSGGTALGVVQEEGGLVYAAVYGGDTKTVVRGSNAAGAFYLSGGIADNFIITNGGMQNVYSGGVARRTLASGMQAMITVYSGGAVSGATVAANASLILNGNTVADGVSVLSGGSMEARLGALVSGVSVWGNAYFTSAMVGGDEASSQKSSEISGMYVGRTGVVSIVKNVVLKDTVTIAGSLTVADGAAVSAYQGGAINFDISGSSAGNAALVDGLSRISGEAGYTLTVSDKQKNGKFILASGAAGFNRTITVKTDKGAGVGELNVGGTLNYGEHYTYSLANENGALALTVGVTGILPPAAPTAKADITSATNRNVTVTAVFGDDAEIKEYSLDGSTWRNYDSGVVMDSNGTVYFRGLNYLDMVSDVTQYAVTNIDRVAPAAPTVKASTTALTNKNVTVTATFSADSAQKQYSTDNKTWKSYTAALSVGANGVFYFRGIDAAGNVSKVASIKVANIDKSVPGTPTVKASTTAATNKNVTVTATFSADSVQKQYSTDNKTWKSYTAALTVGANGVFYFRGINAAGNVSKVASIKVGNIDKVAPKAPTVKASTTAATNKNVTVTATFSADSAQKQYSTDNKTWKSYTAALSVGANGVFYFRGIDAAGNVSEVASIKVANIDKVAPKAPTVKASTTAATNKNVTVTATFSADSAQKQYSTDNKTWKSYTAALSVGANGVFYFRGIDAAGNVSKVASIKVANIDKSAPDAPTAAANTTAPTKNNVIVTAAFGRDSAKKQYSTDNRNWKNYSKPITVKANGTYSFRGISAAGNISPVTTIRVDNIDKVAPTAPTVAVSTTALTNRSVSLTAKFSNDSVKKQYSSDKKTWKNYTGVLSVNANGTYYFRGIDAAGNISKVTNIKIKNIDKVAPSAPTFKLSSSKPTNSLTVTAKFSKDSAVKEYSTDGAKWKPYTDKLLVKTNGTYYFRGTDAAGNVSGVAAARITNIDNVAPAAPTVRADTTAPTNKKVTLTAAFSSDTVKKQYSMDNRSWKNCSKPVAAGKNGTYYFRGIDAAGNISKVVSIKVDNIDTAAPNAPTVTASTAAPTNRNVMLTAKFSNDSVKKQYSSDKKTWKNYTGALAVNANGTYYFRGIDAAGNISKVASIKVGNIDKVAPAAPTVKLSTAKPAAVLTVTAKFSKDSSRKEYSTDGKKWQSCTGKLTVKANGTYYFRGIDAAGNVSKVASVKVANIADTANNSWDSASELTGTVSGVLDRVVDPVDYYEVGDVAKLMMDMESGKAKVTFCGSDKKAVPTEVKCADGSVRTLSAVELTAGDRVNDNITLSDLNDAIRYLKIESAASGAANYRLAKLA